MREPFSNSDRSSPPAWRRACTEWADIGMSYAGETGRLDVIGPKIVLNTPVCCASRPPKVLRVEAAEIGLVVVEELPREHQGRVRAQPDAVGRRLVVEPELADRRCDGQARRLGRRPC